MKELFLAVTIAVTLSGCNLFGPWDPPAEDLVWVQATYVGGSQCDPNGGYEPPDTEALLESAGVAVYDTYVEHQAVCAACGCPSYAATHYAEINEDDVERANGVGFVPGDGPPPR